MSNEENPKSFTPSGPQNDRLSSLMAVNDNETSLIGQQGLNFNNAQSRTEFSYPSKYDTKGEVSRQGQRGNVHNSITGDLRQSTESNIYLEEIEMLKRDNSFLDDQLQRALKELKYYQNFSCLLE